MTETRTLDSGSLTTQGLVKQFAAGFKLGPIDVTLAAGSTTGLIGPNGAGKSTFFQLITGNLDPTSGEIRLGGDRVTPDTPAVKRRFGYLPQEPQLPRWVTAKELLGYAGALYELPDRDAVIDAALKHWDVAYYAHKPLGALSYGMLKRVGLALATLHDPQVLILDEPHSGLDLTHIRALDQTLADRRTKRRTTLMSTHVAPFAAKLCDELLVIGGGTVKPLTGWHDADAQTRVRQIEAAF
jgi:heme exporter protein A